MGEGMPMFDYYITFRSVTYAQRAQRLLAEEHIQNAMMRAPKAMSVKGCGYALRIRASAAAHAAAVLQNGGVPYSAVYRMRADGTAETVAL